MFEESLTDNTMWKHERERRKSSKKFNQELPMAAAEFSGLINEAIN
jgi:hypothetical protein